MNIKNIVNHLPKEIRALFIIKIFSTYTYAVLYASLLLYMTGPLALSVKLATGVVGVFISFNFLLHFLGGYAGGKFISNRLLFVSGMVFEIIGLLTSFYQFYLGLGVFLAGCGLYATSINAIMLQRFKPSDQKRELASFWLYSGMNLGFFIGHTVSGYYHLKGDYHSLFITAIFASVISLILLLLNWHKFDDITTEFNHYSRAKQRKGVIASLLSACILVPFVVLSLKNNMASSALVIILAVMVFTGLFISITKERNPIDKNKLIAFVVLAIAGITFWSLFFIGPLGLTLFIKDYVNQNLFGMIIPPQWFHNINTVIIVLGGPLLAIWFQKKRQQGNDLSAPLLFSIALLLVGSAFAILPLGIYLSSNHLVSMSWIVLSYILQTLGELFLSPVGVAMIGQLAPKGKQGLLLGVWSMVSGIASMISKSLSQLMILPNQTSISDVGIQQYSKIFAEVGVVTLVAGVILLLLVPRLKYLMGLTPKQPLKASLSS